jgi:hypothetical protein
MQGKRKCFSALDFHSLHPDTERKYGRKEVLAGSLHNASEPLFSLELTLPFKNDN